MGQQEKFIERLFHHPTPNDINYREAKSFLESIGCKHVKRRGTSHRVFKYPGYRKNITLMETECLRMYQVHDIRDLLVSIGIVEED